MRFGNAISALTKGAIARVTGRTPETPKHIVDLLTVEPFGSTPRAKSKELADLYSTNPWVRSIVSKVSRAVAKQPWYLEAADGTRVDVHPALKFLNSGSPKLRGRAARQVTAALIDLTGECFWIIDRDRYGRPVQWAPIPPTWAIDTPSETFNGFRVQPRAGAAVEIGSTDVLWIKDHNPIDPYERGSSYTGAASVEIGADEAASDMLRAFFRNRARPDIVITGTEKSPISDKDAPRFEQAWLEKFRGPNRAGRPFFSRAEIKVHEIGSGLKENDFSGVRELGQRMIREFYGVPPEIFGALESSNRATIDAAEALFARHTIDPRLAFMLDAIEAFIEFEFDLGGLRLRYESPIEEDKEFKLKVVQAFPDAFSLNMKRALAGERPVAGGDDLPDPDEDPDNEPDPSEDEEPEDDEDKASAAPVRKAINADDVVRVSSLHEDPEVRANVTAMADEILGTLIAKFGSELLEELVEEANFRVTGQIAEFIAQEVPDLIGRIDETTRKELRASLVEGVARGENVAALVARVDAVFAEASKIRASIIGDTVATKIAGFATQIAGEQGGFEQKKWLSTRDQLVRSTHTTLDGQTVPLNGDFVSSAGYRAKHPGAFGVASEDVNCRCAMRPIVPGEERAVRDDAAFIALHTKLWNRSARAIRKTFEDIFEGQRAVIVHELQRMGEFRV